MVAILPTRVLREQPGILPAVIRQRARTIDASSNTGGFFTRDPYRNCRIEISLNDFGLEESYGRFVQEKAYGGDPQAVSGSLVDLYV